MIPIDDDVQEVLDWDVAMNDPKKLIPFWNEYRVISYALWWTHSNHERHHLGSPSLEEAISVCQHRGIRNTRVWLPDDEDSP